MWLGGGLRGSRGPESGWCGSRGGGHQGTGRCPVWGQVDGLGVDVECVSMAS